MDIINIVMGCHGETKRWSTNIVPMGVGTTGKRSYFIRCYKLGTRPALFLAAEGCTELHRCQQKDPERTRTTYYVCTIAYIYIHMHIEGFNQQKWWDCTACYRQEWNVPGDWVYLSRWAHLSVKNGIPLEEVSKVCIDSSCMSEDLFSFCS